MRASRFSADVTRWRPSGALPQPREHLQAGKTVSVRHAHFLLESAHGPQRADAKAAIDALRIKTGGGEALLKFLCFRQGQPAFAAGKLLLEIRQATDQVAEMQQREGIRVGW